MLQEYYGSRKAIRTYLLTGKFVNIRLPPLDRLPVAEGKRKAIPKPKQRPNNAQRRASYKDRLARDLGEARRTGQTQTSRTTKLWKRGLEQAAQAEVGSSKRHKGEPCVSARSRDGPGSNWLGESKSWENRCRGGGRDHWGENRCRDDDRSRSRGREQQARPKRPPWGENRCRDDDRSRSRGREQLALSQARPKYQAKQRPRPSRAPDRAPDPPRLRSRSPAPDGLRLRSRFPAPDGLRLRSRSPAPESEAPWKISARLRSRADRRPERRGADRPARRGAT